MASSAPDLRDGFISIRLEFGAETTADCHVVKIVLRTLNIRFSVSGRTVQDGVTTPGMVHVTEPAVPARCLFRGPYDVLHLYVPNTLIAEYARDMPGQHAPVLRCEAVPRKDMILDSLGRALLEANRVGGSFGQTYADCISMAIVARLLGSANGVGTSERSRESSKLAPWRLKRAIDYVESRLDERISLAEVASSAGLTRMHFAAQFRAATGLRPHEYLLRRRIERAQEMLVGTGMSLVDVALSVGFQTQSHFTSVFKRYAGQAPRAWRESRDEQTGWSPRGTRGTRLLRDELVVHSGDGSCVGRRAPRKRTSGSLASEVGEQA